MLEEILKRIRPTEEEIKEISNLAENVIKNIYDVANEKGYNILEALWLGSSARNTHLKGDHDIDIFILFDKSVSIDELEVIALDIGKEVIKRLNGKCQINYASHPYIQGIVGKYKVDIVPCYKINFGEKIISAVDRTPLHHKFLIERLDEKLCDEVRLLKAFLKSLNLYGSDVKTKGFSGYLCELLILHYKSFLNLLNDAKDWGERKKIILNDIFELYKNPKFREFDEPLIVYDPVDLNRNVAAPLSRENYCKFIFFAREFLKNMNEEFFNDYYKKLEEKLENRDKGFILTLKFPKTEVDDIIYPQLEKFQKSLNKLIEQNEFKILNCKCYTDSDYAYIEWEFLVYQLPKIKLRDGPEVFEKERVEKFIKKYDKVFIKGCKLYAFTERKYCHILELFKDIIEGKIKNISKPKHIDIKSGVILWKQAT
ncbi:tRNA CCA-pyrophosphorylase [Methanocaldococcus villosus KIN24-T80]|uniref:CCA-adding enzyme n=1 Tax=Methanocaldococcus villosus KIN24-T80 TaxID=1069083 RepID=N6VQZ1_9EURY|nr:CCA tRNA nucleotidyltransferase [Methanocaldococcus villosus]ENN96320.1 tRNA CCA-pyrophosphorylase [Methanocaldococcus villosus KIN24-T80]